jgi:hypothetical protein
VVDADGRELAFVDSGSRTSIGRQGRSFAYSNFLLQKVGIQRSELRQFIKTFGLTYLFLFGENPIMLSVSGVLIHSPDFPWDEEWWTNYESMLRATKSAEFGARVYLCYDRTLVEGYILEAGTDRDAGSPTMAPLTFNMVATNVKFLSPVGRTDFPLDRYTVDLTQPQTPVGGAQTLPVGRQLSYTTQSMSGQAGRAAMLPATDQAMIQFGSFQDMFQYLTSSAGQGVLGGISGKTDIGKQLMGTQGSQYRYPVSKRGAISTNLDEYVMRAPTQDSPEQDTAQDRVDQYQRMAEADEEAEMAGDVARSVIDNGDPDSINLSNTEGLSGSHGTAMVEGDLDTTAPANASASRLRSSPFSTTPVTVTPVP